MIFCIDYKVEWYATIGSASPKGTLHIVLECLFKIMLITLKSYFCIKMKEKQRVCLKKLNSTSCTAAVFLPVIKHSDEKQYLT